MTYRIFSRMPFEATHPLEPTSITRLEREGIMTAAYALKLARLMSEREACYDIDFEVVDQNGQAVYAYQLYADAHVRDFHRHRLEADDHFPW